MSKNRFEAAEQTVPANPHIQRPFEREAESIKMPHRDSRLFNGDFWGKPVSHIITSMTNGTFGYFEVARDTTWNLLVTVIGGVMDMYFDAHSVSQNLGTHTPVNPPQASARFSPQGGPWIIPMPPGRHRIGYIAANNESLTASLVAIPHLPDTKAAIQGMRPVPSHYGTRDAG